MELLFDFPTGWYLLLTLIYIPYFFLLSVRASHVKKEYKLQLFLAAIALILAFVVEYLGISLSLWNYNPGNWPLPLWFCYAGIGLLGFQIIKLMEKMFKY